MSIPTSVKIGVPQIQAIKSGPNGTPFHPHISIEDRSKTTVCNSVKWGSPSKEDQTYRKEPMRTYRSL